MLVLRDKDPGMLPDKQRRGEVARILRGESRSVLLTGVALNWLGAAKIAREVWLTKCPASAPADYDQMKAFAAGTATTFGSYHLYLYATKKRPYRG